MRQPDEEAMRQLLDRRLAERRQTLLELRESFGFDRVEGNAPRQPTGTTPVGDSLATRLGIDADELGTEPNPSFRSVILTKPRRPRITRRLWARNDGRATRRRTHIARPQAFRFPLSLTRLPRRGRFVFPRPAEWRRIPPLDRGRHGMVRSGLPFLRSGRPPHPHLSK